VLVPKAKLEIFIPDELIEVVVETITKAARTGQFGDGKIFISDVLEVVKIRTGERGSGAI
jgi:nitrogen regulatory protein P-II 1